VNCDEFNERISAGVDGKLPQDELEAFLDHAGRCRACRCEYEEELRIRDLLRSRIRAVNVPVALVDSIEAMIRREDTGSSERPAPWYRQLLEAPPLKPALALAGVAVLAALLVRVVHRGEADGHAADVLEQSVSNYHDVLHGALKPQLVSSEPSRVVEFFSGKTGFPVLVPPLAGWTLMGGVCTTFSGEPVAHLVFRRSDQFVYVYQACWDCVRKGEKLCLPERARSSLERTGFYSEQLQNGNSIVVWRSGRALCAAVAPVGEHELLGYILSAKEPAVH
jgi:anti-sigma factor RsiW